jgi:hypothetical protein
LCKTHYYIKEVRNVLISAAMLLDRLGDCVAGHNISKENDPWFNSVRLYYPGFPSCVNVEACVVSASDIISGAALGDTCLKIIAAVSGEEIEPDAAGGACIICQGGIMQIFDRINMYLAEWNRFDEQARAALLDRDSLSDYIEIAADFLKLPMTVIDDTMNFVCRSSNQFYDSLPDYSKFSKPMRVPFDVLDQMLLLNELDRIIKHREVFAFDSEVMYTPVVMANFFRGDTYLGRISACDGRDDYSQGTLDGVECVRRHVQPMVQRLASGGGQEYIYDAHFIRRILLGDITDSRFIAKAMRELGFPDGSVYLCLYMKLTSVSLSGNLVKHFITMLHERFDWPCVIPFENDIVALFPHLQSYKSNQDLLIFLRDSSVCAGLSEPFVRYDRMPLALRQAKTALETGCRLDETQRLFRYNKYATEIAVREFAQLPGIEAYFHRAVHILRDYDREHGTEYCFTLRCMAEGYANQKQLASQLFIHRNTLQYRIDRIRELVDVDLENPDERIRISLTYRLMEAKEAMSAEAADTERISEKY